MISSRELFFAKLHASGRSGKTYRNDFIHVANALEEVGVGVTDTILMLIDWMYKLEGHVPRAELHDEFDRLLNKLEEALRK